jgi:alginate O-acetyltransferase complex protein AlgJ
MPIFLLNKPNPKQPAHQANDTGLRILSIILFLIFLWLPLLDMCFHFLPKIEQTEKRALAQAPQLRRNSLNDFPIYYERFFNDQFGGRSILIRLNNFIHFKWFQVSPLKGVLVGKEGWLFYTLDKSMADFRGAIPFSPVHLQKIAQNLSRQTAWLRERGIPYAMLISPNKSTIYPEYMPDNLTRVSRKTRLDQVLEYVSPEEKTILVDVRKALLAAKKDQWVYGKTDTHWNAYGAFIAYREWMKSLSNSFPTVIPLPSSDFTFSVRPEKGVGDLAEMLSLVGRLDDRGVYLKLTDNPSFRTEKIPKAVLFHDSFVWSLNPFLEHHFEQIVLQHWGKKGFDYGLIEKEKPQVVLFEIAERHLDILLKYQ